MRFHPSPSEARLWSELRARKLGVQFRRQVVLGNATVDFFASSGKLIVELDGDVYHEQCRAADAARDSKLWAAGYRVLRLPASLVERRLGEAVRLVWEGLAYQIPL